MKSTQLLSTALILPLISFSVKAEEPIIKLNVINPANNNVEKIEINNPVSRGEINLVEEKIEPDKIKGTFTIMGFNNIMFANGSCLASKKRGYIAVGTNVTLKDGYNNIVGITQLGIGKKVFKNQVMGCEFKFVFTDVPEKQFYTISIGNQNLPYSHQQIQQQGYRVRIVLY